MTENKNALGSDLAKVDAYENTAADYQEVPELTGEDLARGTWHIGGEPVNEAEGRTAMAAAMKPRGRPPVNGGKEHINLRVDKDVLSRFRSDGPGWQGRMNEALRKAVGL